MTRAAVIGAGTMGNGIAHVFAQHGWEVRLVDSAAEALEKATQRLKARTQGDGEANNTRQQRPNPSKR
jgi:3-hydroxyacyl-CoA dehydrogenase